MTKKLGDFEQIVLLAVMRLGEGAYGVTIRQEIQERTGRDVALGAIYPTLDRLEEKGYVISWVGDPTSKRGGRAKRHFKLEAAGLAALHRARRELEAMWAGYDAEPAPGEPRD